MTALRKFATALGLGALVLPVANAATVTISPGEDVYAFNWDTVISNIGVAGAGIIGLMVAVVGIRYLLATIK